MNIKNMIECWASDTDAVLAVVSDLPTDCITVRRVTRNYNAVTVRTSLVNWLKINHRLKKLRKENDIVTQLYLGTN